jgi:predicted dehydrogenase
MTMSARPNLGVEDNAAALVTFNNGAMGIFDCSTSANPMLGSKLELVGSRQSIRTQNGEVEAWGQKSTGEIRSINEKTAQHGHYIPGRNYYGYGHALQLQDFVNCVRENKLPQVTAQDGLATLKVVLAIMASARQRTAVVLD